MHSIDIFIIHRWLANDRMYRQTHRFNQHGKGRKRAKQKIVGGISYWWIIWNMHCCKLNIWDAEREKQPPFCWVGWRLHSNCTFHRQSAWYHLNEKWFLLEKQQFRHFCFPALGIEQKINHDIPTNKIQVLFSLKATHE